jgi:hypothetical protein
LARLCFKTIPKDTEANDNKPLNNFNRLEQHFANLLQHNTINIVNRFRLENDQSKERELFETGSP